MDSPDQVWPAESIDPYWELPSFPWDTELVMEGFLCGLQSFFLALTTLD